MKRPKSIKIGGVDWSLNWSSAKKSGADPDRFGETRFAASEVWVNPEQASNMIHSTLLHEVIHGVLLNAGIAGKESLVRALEVGLCQILRDNKWFAEWLKNGRAE